MKFDTSQTLSEARNLFINANLFFFVCVKYMQVRKLTGTPVNTMAGAH